MSLVKSFLSLFFFFLRKKKSYSAEMASKNILNKNQTKNI